MDSHKRSLGFISLAFLFITCSSAEFLIQQVTEGKGTENNSYYNVEANLGETRAFREERPSSKIVTIAGYSVIKGRFEPYESSVFEAAGYRWRLVLYVIGNKNDGGAGHISLYVRMEETESLPMVGKSMLISNSLSTIQRPITAAWYPIRSDYGVGVNNIILLSDLKDPSKGYLVNDAIIFEAEMVKVSVTNIVSV
ncbi:hypothetical protein Bca101_028725 [Brassica carinata]